MTENNLLQEIEDDLERQRYEELWKKFGPWIMLFAAVVIVSTGVTSWWKTTHADRAQKATVGLYDIMEKYGKQPDPPHEMGEMESFAIGTPHGIQPALAKLDAAGIASSNGKVDRAVQLYDEIAHDGSTDKIFQQYASLMAVRVQMDSGDPAQLEARLQPLLADDVPWRYTATEYEGFLMLRKGDKDQARKIFLQLSQDGRAPQALSHRAAIILASLGG